MLVRNSSGSGWLSKFLRIYTLVFLLASDIDETVEEKLLIWDHPKERIHVRKEVELSELTADELTFFDYPEAVLAEVNRQQEKLHGNNTKGSPKANGYLSPPTNGQKRHAEEPPSSAMQFDQDSPRDVSTRLGHARSSIWRCPL
ncbi:hypothetical protein DFH11DRAFT_1736785 [Phellopilus nigrolimitatus]|nr:hypothetical protein DFH11DRAFT_1736785 [Phellopilus nigrolimitatus]